MNNNGFAQRSPSIKREEETEHNGLHRPSYVDTHSPSLRFSSTYRAPQTNLYRPQYSEDLRYGGETDSPRRVPTSIGSHGITNGSHSADRGSSSRADEEQTRSRVSRELFEVCPFELKGIPCQMPNPCRKKTVCVVSFSLGMH